MDAMGIPQLSIKRINNCSRLSHGCSWKLPAGLADFKRNNQKYDTLFPTILKINYYWKLSSKGDGTVFSNYYFF